MWPGGTEVEFDTHFDQYYRFMSEDSEVANPNDVRVTKQTFQLAWTHGLSTNWAIRIEAPFTYAHREDDSGSQDHFGLDDWVVGLSYRLDPLIFGEPYNFKGGSFRIGAYSKFRLPTAEKRDVGKTLTGRKMSFGDETFGVRLGAYTALSTEKYYVWTELSGEASAFHNGTGHGPSAKLHLAWARRVVELQDYRELDLITLVEFDVEYRGKGQINGNVNPNSGYFKTHLGLGLQVNVTNIWEVKLGYNIPLYRRFNGRQFVHDGVLAASVSYLF
ncbi:MAG: hypothetical protein KDB07_04665 [Planctomycetes bacterium]|nr:hypothetical protein [Planctomycetota bacterium]